MWTCPPGLRRRYDMQIVITGTVVVEKDGTEIGRLALATGPTGIGCDPPVPLAPSVWEQRPADF